MTAGGYVAPAQHVSCVGLGAGADPTLVEAAVTRLRTEPGLGAVVVGTPPGPATVVAHARHLARTARREGEPEQAWLRRLHAHLVAWGYLVEDADGRAWQPPAEDAAAVRAAVRWARTPLSKRVRETRRRSRRRRFLRRLRVEAWLAGCDLHLDVADDLVVGRDVRVVLRPTPTRLTIGPRCSIADGVLLRLGGELVLGRNTELRHDVALNVKGRLELQGRNGLARGTMVHADGAMLWEWGACSSEYVTVLDSHHEYDGSLVHVHDQGLDVRDITIGAGSLLGAKATVLPGVRIGRACLVGASSVVTKDVPNGFIALGFPAKAIRPVISPEGS